MKFLTLLKKELRELINMQMILGLVITVVMLLVVGNVMSGVMDDAATETGVVNIIDRDKSMLTQQYIIEVLEDTGYTVNLVEAENDDPAKLLSEAGCDSLLIIPQGFYESLKNSDEPLQLELISSIKTTSVMASLSDKTASVVDFISNVVSGVMMAEKDLDISEINRIENPVVVNEVTVVQEKSAVINSQMLMSLISSQGMFIPIVVFILVMFTSQMIISAISTEKIDKTLETLLSAPVSRISVLGAKMLAAAIVAIINAAVYMVGFYGYMGSMLSGQIDSEIVGSTLTVNDIMTDLGLNIGVTGYIMVGLQMFMTIMVCLAVSLILGALVNDAKSAQTMLMPIMVCAMVPYIVSMVYDINLLSPVFRTVMYAIPFTHTFNAMNNIMFGNTELYWAGLGYQFILFLVCMAFALKIFTSDKIFTISLNFGQKKKFKSKKK